MKYKIIGGNLPAVRCLLDRGEAIICESGGMSWKDSSIKMETKGGGAGKMFKRAFTGESMFTNRYVAEAPGEIAFASSFPGEIVAVKLDGSKSIVAQKSAFLASEEGVQMDIFFQKKLGSGFFGGEGFIMQKFSGTGMVFLEVDGATVTYELGPGESKSMDTGHLVIMEDTCTMDIERIKGFKNVLLGGEGLFNTVVKGPGKIVIQTMPIAKTAQVLGTYIPKDK